MGFIKVKQTALAVTDREGVVRLRKEKANYLIFSKGQQAQTFNHFLEENTTYSDANATIRDGAALPVLPDMEKFVGQMDVQGLLRGEASPLPGAVGGL